MSDESTKALTTPQVMALLRERYAPPEFALLPQVRSRTGYSGPIRTADALAMSLYPSRGLLLHGFEVKVSRSDWLRELKEPDKAEEIVAYCDRWWIVVGDEKIVQPGELPPTWGLLVPRRGKLAIKVDAPELSAAPMSRAFLAALLRNVAEATKDVVPRAEIVDQIVAARALGETIGARETADDLARLRKTVETFEAQAGIKIDAYHGMHIGEAVRAVMNDGLVQRRRELDGIKATIARLSAALQEEP